MCFMSATAAPKRAKQLAGLYNSENFPILSNFQNIGKNFCHLAATVKLTLSST